MLRQMGYMDSVHCCSGLSRAYVIIGYFKRATKTPSHNHVDARWKGGLLLSVKNSTKVAHRLPLPWALDIIPFTPETLPSSNVNILFKRVFFPNNEINFQNRFSFTVPHMASCNKIVPICISTETATTNNERR